MLYPERFSAAKKLLVIILIGPCLIGLASGCIKSGKALQNPTFNKERENMVLVGHRGAAGLAPENTLAAFRKAMEFRVDGLELDVFVSADGEVVVHHDFMLKPEITRTIDGHWLSDQDRKAIKDLTLDQLKSYDVGRLKTSTVYARRYPHQQPVDGERIPILREVIGLLKERNDTQTGLWVEIKTSPETPELTPGPDQVVEAVIAVLKSESVLNRSRILSFDWRPLLYCQKRYPEVPLVFLSYSGTNLDNIKPGHPGPSPWTAGIDVDDFGGSIPRAIHHLGGRNWGPHFRSLRADAVAEAHRLGIKVFPWTPDDKDDMDRLVRLGVNGIITNRPDVFRSLMPVP